jgi:hypothetical protein
MPGGDRSGPIGAGPRTGRGLGYCSGYEQPGWTRGGASGRAGFGRGGFGFGRGRCRGWGLGRAGRGLGRGWFCADPYPNAVDERKRLENERSALEQRLGAIDVLLSQDGGGSGSNQD